MNRNKFLGLLAVLLVSVSLVSFAARAQDTKAAPDQKKMIPLKVLVVFEEYDGQKKIASLPYTFRVIANDKFGPHTSIRDGLRVPVSLGNSSGAASNTSTQFQYMDVGANMDCTADSAEEGAFKVDLNVQRTFLFTPDELKPAMDLNKATIGAGGNPVIQTFNSHYDLLMRDAQTIEATSVTNPLNGRVLKVIVTINVEK